MVIELPGPTSLVGSKDGHCFRDGLELMVMLPLLPWLPRREWLLLPIRLKLCPLVDLEWVREFCSASDMIASVALYRKQKHQHVHNTYCYVKVHTQNVPVKLPVK